MFCVLKSIVKLASKKLLIVSGKKFCTKLLFVVCYNYEFRSVINFSSNIRIQIQINLMKLNNFLIKFDGTWISLISNEYKKSNYTVSEKNLTELFKLVSLIQVIIRTRKIHVQLYCFISTNSLYDLTNIFI